MKIRTFVIALFFLFPGSASLLHADDSDFTIKAEAGVDYLFGYTQYGIGWNQYDLSGTQYSIGFQVSQLKFPLDSLGFYADTEMTIFQILLLSIHFDKNITMAPGKMEDSDWGYWYLQGNTWASPTSLDIFSQSDEAMNTFSLDASLHYILPLESIWSISFGVGFIFQYIYCEESNTDQWYPSYNDYSTHLASQYGDRVSLSGLVATYRVDYFIPLLEIKVGLQPGDVFGISLLVGFSPLTFAQDTDDHILRSKLATDNSLGISVRSRLDCDVHFTSWLYAGADVRFLFIHTEGKQVQFRYNDTSEGPAGPLGSVDEKIDSLQFSAGIHIGVSF